MQTTRVDFTKIENLISNSGNEQRPQEKNHNGQRQRTPHFYIVPVIYSSLQHYLHSLGQIQFNSQHIAIADYPHAQCQPISIPEQMPTSQSDSGNTQKLTRTQFSSTQEKLLNERFTKLNRIGGQEKEEFARKLGLTPKQVERWFYYRRVEKVKAAQNKMATYKLCRAPGKYVI